MVVFFCAPDDTGAENQDCAPYDPRPEAAAITRLPGVSAATRTTAVFGTYMVHGGAVPGPLTVVLDEDGFPTAEGRPATVHYRPYWHDSGTTDFGVRGRASGLQSTSAWQGW